MLALKSGQLVCKNKPACAPSSMSEVTNKPAVTAVENTNKSVVLTPPTVQVDHMARFNEIFALESELVGAVYRKKSEKGAVRLGVLNAKDLKAVTGKDGDELKEHRRNMTDALKLEAGALVTRLMADPRYTGRTIQLNAKGNVLTIAFEKVESKVPKLTEAQTKEIVSKEIGNMSIEQLQQLIDKAKLEASNNAKQAEANKPEEQKPTPAPAPEANKQVPTAPAANQPAKK